MILKLLNKSSNAFRTLFNRTQSASVTTETISNRAFPNKSYLLEKRGVLRNYQAFNFLLIGALYYEAFRDVESRKKSKTVITNPYSD